MIFNLFFGVISTAIFFKRKIKKYRPILILGILSGISDLLLLFQDIYHVNSTHNLITFTFIEGMLFLFYYYRFFSENNPKSPYLISFYLLTIINLVTFIADYYILAHHQFDPFQRKYLNAFSISIFCTLLAILALLIIIKKGDQVALVNNSDLFINVAILIYFFEGLITDSFTFLELYFHPENNKLYFGICEALYTISNISYCILMIVGVLNIKKTEELTIRK